MTCPVTQFSSHTVSRWQSQSVFVPKPWSLWNDIDSLIWISGHSIISRPSTYLIICRKPVKLVHSLPLEACVACMFLPDFVQINVLYKFYLAFDWFSAASISNKSFVNTLHSSIQWGITLYLPYGFRALGYSMFYTLYPTSYVLLGTQMVQWMEAIISCIPTWVPMAVIRGAWYW